MTPTLQEVLSKLKALGLSNRYVRDHALPAWWKDDIADTRLGFMQAVGYLSVLGVDVSTLLDPDTPARFVTRHVQWKTPRNVSHDDLEVVKGLAAQAAQIANEAAPTATKTFPRTALELRERLLSRAGFVGFESWLEECWDCGIIVLSLTENAFPLNAKRPHGLALNFETGAAIVLTGKERHPAWQLFRGLHETGHIVCGHLKDAEVLVDEDLARNEQDIRERQANDFAEEVLYGQKLSVTSDSPLLSMDSLEINALRSGTRYRVDPGALILNWANNMSHTSVNDANCWATAQNVLRRLPGPDAVDLMRQVSSRRLQWEELSENQALFLKSICGIEERQTAEIA